MQNEPQRNIDLLMTEATFTSDLYISCILTDHAIAENADSEISFIFVNGYEREEYQTSLGQLAVNIELETVKRLATIPPPMRAVVLMEVCEKINSLIYHNETEQLVDVGMFSEASSGNSFEPLDIYNLSDAQRALYNELSYEFSQYCSHLWHHTFTRLLHRMDMHSVSLLQMSLGIRAIGVIPNGKILINTSVPNLAAALRILDERNLIGNKTKSEIIQCISKYFSTPGSESISARSLRNHYYDPDPSSLEFWENEADKFKKVIDGLIWDSHKE